MRGEAHLAIGILTSVEVALLTDNPITLAGILVAAISSGAPDLDESNSMLVRKMVPGKAIQLIKKLSILLGLVGILVGYFTAKWIWVATGLSGIMISNMLGENDWRKLGTTLFGVFLNIFPFVFGNAGVNLERVFDFAPFILMGAFLLFSTWLAHRGPTHSLLAASVWSWLLFLIEVRYNISHIHWMGTIAYLSHLVVDTLTKRGVPWLWPFVNRNFAIPIMTTGSRQGNFIEQLSISLLAAVLIITLI